MDRQEIAKVDGLRWNEDMKQGMLVELLVMILIYFDLLLDLFLSSVCLTM
jgi:hypothetical protein